MRVAVRHVLDAESETPTEQQRKKRDLITSFPSRACHAWLTLCCQVVKSLVLYRITPKLMKNLGGITASVASLDSAMTHSSVYSVSECYLLKWLSHHAAKGLVHGSSEKRVMDFCGDLKDGTVLAGNNMLHWLYEIDSPF